MNSSRILVCLYSDANFLALNILENLLSKNSQVTIATSDLDGWRKKTDHLVSNSHFSITNVKDLESLSTFNYSIFCGGFISKGDGYKSLKNFIYSRSLETSKRLAILPFETFSAKEDGQIDISGNLGVVYVGDLLGPRLDLDSDLLVNRLVNEIVTKREITLAVGEKFYPIFVGDAAKKIAKWLISFGPYGKEIFLLGPQVSSTSFWAANQKIVKNIGLNYDNKVEPRFVPKNFEVEPLSINLNFALLEAYKWLSRLGSLNSRVIKTRKTARYPKFFLPVFLTIFTVLVFPFLMIIASLGAIYFSYRDFLSGGEGSAINKILIAKTLFVVGGGEGRVFANVPLAGKIYKEAVYLSDVGQKLTDAAVSAIPTISTAKTTFNNVLGDTVYDPTGPAQEIQGGMNTLYREASVLQAQTLEAEESGTYLAKLLLTKVNFDEIKNYFKQGEVLATNLPGLLGKDQRKTYLILFQNNMELRPTGGFIGSFGLLTFEGGRMTDLSVNDVYSADGQLRGHVEPPTPIKDYLNEANWWLRDSNWDPDFPTSAKRAEWFLDKEISTQVDGVFAIDLKTVEDILKVTGPVFLADYNLDITSDNLYEKTQSEAQDRFFPGSHQKASFLTALSRNLIGEVEKLGDKQKLLILKSFLKNFEERHIQAFLHNNSSQNAISSLGWSGEITEPSCGEDCYADLVGLAEANFGVNKANYFLTRKADLTVNLDKGVITRNLTLTLANSANQALGQSGTYNVYIRTFIPNDSTLLGTKEITGENEENLESAVVESHGRQEVGVFVKVLGGQSKKIEFTWATSVKDNLNPQSYGLYIRKQAGVSDDPWQITIASGNPALTESGVYTYNTVLARDFFLRLGK